MIYVFRKECSIPRKELFQCFFAYNVLGVDWHGVETSGMNGVLKRE